MKEQIVEWFRLKPLLAVTAIAIGALLASALAFLSGLAFTASQIVVLYVATLAASVLVAKIISEKYFGVKPADNAGVQEKAESSAAG